MHPCNKTESPCKNGATCEELADQFVCRCADGWEGTTCEKKGDYFAIDIFPSLHLFVTKKYETKLKVNCLFLSKFILVIRRSHHVRMEVLVKRMEMNLFVIVLKIGLEKLVK